MLEILLTTTQLLQRLLQCAYIHSIFTIYFQLCTADLWLSYNLIVGSDVGMVSPLETHQECVAMSIFSCSLVISALEVVFLMVRLATFQLCFALVSLLSLPADTCLSFTCGSLWTVSLRCSVLLCSRLIRIPDQLLPNVNEADCGWTYTVLLCAYLNSWFLELSTDLLSSGVMSFGIIFTTG